ncbi:hypothetical protein, partial [Pseudomonas sp.]|uniref:hypothetical protein n=1 Tax=Pseudomonas sp. TaxID=306 RepID=UPI00289CDE6E
QVVRRASAARAALDLTGAEPVTPNTCHLLDNPACDCLYLSLASGDLSHNFVQGIERGSRRWRIA